MRGLRPDFLTSETGVSSGSNYYPSAKILGKLFRRVPVEIVDAVPESSDFGVMITDAVEQAARREHRMLGLPSIREHPEELLDEMDAMMDAYSVQLMEIAKSHTQSRRVNDFLTEPELVSGTIQGKWNDHRKRREAVAAMELQVRHAS